MKGAVPRRGVHKGAELGAPYAAFRWVGLVPVDACEEVLGEGGGSAEFVGFDLGWYVCNGPLRRWLGRGGRGGRSENLLDLVVL